MADEEVNQDVLEGVPDVDGVDEVRTRHSARDAQICSTSRRHHALHHVQWLCVII